MLQIREKETTDIERINLIVTSQSEGDEHIKKIILDAAVNLTVDLVANAVLGTLTGGSYKFFKNGYLSACGGASPKNIVASAGVNLSLALLEEEFLGPNSQGKPIVEFSHKGLKSGFSTPIPGIKVPEVKSFRTTDLTEAERLTGLKYKKDVKIEKMAWIPNHCALLEQPFDVLKNEIKATYSAASLGGLGAGEAAGVKMIAICIPESAQLEDAAYSAYFSMSRRTEVLPKEPKEVLLSSLPYDKIWNSYPFPDEVSDKELITDLLNTLENSTKADRRNAAQTILRAMGRKSVRREMVVGGGETGDIYDGYKIKFWQFPYLSAVVGPGQQLGDGIVEGVREEIGDFELTPDETVIPTSSVVIASASRSNENAGASAIVETGGFEMIIQGAIIHNKQ
jgi:hypothetical protein